LASVVLATALLVSGTGLGDEFNLPPGKPGKGAHPHAGPGMLPISCVDCVVISTDNDPGYSNVWEVIAPPQPTRPDKIRAQPGKGDRQPKPKPIGKPGGPAPTLVAAAVYRNVPNWDEAIKYLSGHKGSSIKR